MKLATRWLPILMMLVVLDCAWAASSHAQSNPLHRPGQPAAPGHRSLQGEIIVVDPDSLDCVQVTTFDDIPGGPAPGTNYDGVFASIGVFFAERFVGQTLSASGDHDVVTGNPTNPLTLQTGASQQNLNVVEFNSTNVLDGLGPLGYPDFNAIGEGAMSIYFSEDQSQFSFQLVGGDGGSADLSFYRQDGSLIDVITVSGLADIAYGFKRAGDVKDITGVLIQNTDPGGIGLDNVCHDVAVTPTRTTSWGRIKSLYR